MMYSASILAFAASASAHMVLNTPAPFKVNSSPLSPEEFPCKATGPDFYKGTAATSYKAGDTIDVSFTGSAVHGGGSCQFSLTTDTAPTKDSQWKVIHSVIGGCPSNVTGNIDPADPAGHLAAAFPVALPKDLPSGDYTFAWSWLNKIGNREFYMNCAPIKVSGGSGSVQSVLGKLPDMFVANLPATSCTTKEEQDFNYPNPGQSVTKPTAGKVSYGNTLSGSGCDAMTAMGAGKGSLGSVSGGTGNGNGQASASPSAAPSAAPSPSGGVFAPGASAPASQQTSFATVIATKTAATAAPTQPASVPASGKCAPCPVDGAVVCFGSTQFGLCDHGCAVPQALALGMTCANGAVVRRSARIERVHRHRRQHGSNLL